MRKLKLRDDASPTKLTEPGFVQSFEPGQTHEVPEPVFADYADGSLFVPADDRLEDLEDVEYTDFLDNNTVEEVKEYVDSLQVTEATHEFVDGIAEHCERDTLEDYLVEKSEEMRENLKSTENEE